MSWSSPHAGHCILLLHAGRVSPPAGCRPTHRWWLTTTSSRWATRLERARLGRCTRGSGGRPTWPSRCPSRPNVVLYDVSHGGRGREGSGGWWATMRHRSTVGGRLGRGETIIVRQPAGVKVFRLATQVASCQSRKSSTFFSHHPDFVCGSKFWGTPVAVANGGGPGPSACLWKKRAARDDAHGGAGAGVVGSRAPRRSSSFRRWLPTLPRCSTRTRWPRPRYKRRPRHPRV